MNNVNKTQQGFTLVELIIVIVILGILAVTAAPRFLNFQSDAKASVLDGVVGSLNAGVKLVEGKAIIGGQNTTALSCFDNNAVRVAVAAETGHTDIDTDRISCITGTDVRFGAPDADVGSILATADLTGGIVAHDTQTGAALTPALTVAAGTVVIANNLQDLRDARCLVTYTVATSATVRPTVVANSTNCN
jgi:prepilin-type N-terminal cleavage/methylation domain-containing protein